MRKRMVMMAAAILAAAAICGTAGDVPGNLQARLAKVEGLAAAKQAADADLTRLAANNAGSLTNLVASNLASGTVPNARLDADLQTVAAKTLTVITLTNVIYNAGHSTGTFNVVRWQ
jgi:hypothetical protein